jgi:hypothetical protein
MLRDEDDYFPKEDRKELLNLIKDLYNEHIELVENKNDKGKYGIRYKTIHDDSKYSDTSEIFFRLKSIRDKVFDDWQNGLYWDNIFEQELEFRLPSPNFHGAIKIFREGKEIYEEK